MEKRCSLIIRTYNEERWISACLTAVYNQNYKNFEVIIVDNQSTDRTLEKAGNFPIDKIVSCEEYLPGKALNIGIRASTGDYIICLSGHCIPVDEHWLKNLVYNLDTDANAAGVYGRQEPMAFSSDGDKRDLHLVFGLDKKYQKKDSFFHNANSILRRSLWDQVPFDEEITNIEDRVWAQEMLNLGHSLIYEPEARVYHHHGIHHDGNHKRCANVVRIIENLHDSRVGGSLKANSLNIVAIIPEKGPRHLLNGFSTTHYTIKNALASKYIKQVFVATDDEHNAETARNLNVVPIVRPPSLSEGFVGLEAVLKYALDQIESKQIYPDLVVSLEPTFPFRPPGLIDDIIDHLLSEGLDTVIAARWESGSLWQEDDNKQIQRLDSGYAPREYKERSFLGLKGLCCVTYAGFLRQEQLLGNKIGLFEVNDPFVSIEVRTERDLLLAKHMMDAWNKKYKL